MFSEVIGDHIHKLPQHIVMFGGKKMKYVCLTAAYWRFLMSITQNILRDDAHVTKATLTRNYEVLLYNKIKNKKKLY